MKNEILQLRSCIKRSGFSAYLVTSDDFHGSEYVGDYFKFRQYLSGFTGSAGTLLVTESSAALWTDGRYFLQAERELSCTEIELMKSGERGVPTLEEYLLDRLPRGGVLAFDGKCVSAKLAKRLTELLREKNISTQDGAEFYEIWKSRPALSANPVFSLSKAVCGRTRAEKLSDIREKMRDENADALVLSALDEIAWTLDLRGADIDFCPLFLSFLLIFSDKARLFAQPQIFSEKIAAELLCDGVEILPYDEIYTAVGSLGGRVWVDVSSVNFRLYSSIKNAEIIEKSSPVGLMKAVKNPPEILGEKRAHLRDGLAVTRFIKWLKTAVLSEKITELSAAEKLEEFRRAGENYLGQSFAPIIAYGAHGAVVHYSADAETNIPLEPRGLVLCDTGGHYLDGTTDITRTVVLGELSDEEKRAFTLVLAGHLELLGAIFPEGARGSAIDYAARAPLWQNGLDFNHATGHGVGFLLNVHEGPQRISFRASGDEPLRAGMITSDEPGFYSAGKFGVRHESLLLCEKARFEGFLGFTALTLVPFDRSGVEKSLLTDRQVALLNEYHKRVFDELSPLMTEEERAWLAEQTAPI